MADLMRVLQMVMRDRDDKGSERDEMLLAIFTGEDATVFGRPVRFTVEWSDGVPLHMTHDEFTAWARGELEKIRGRRSAYFTQLREEQTTPPPTEDRWMRRVTP